MEPNETWTADFKGEFPMRNSTLCYPLTVQDMHSRFLLECRARPDMTIDGVIPVFTRLFRRCGLPERIRTDNGTPFASNALGRLSRLSVWFVQLGILPELIEPASPYQNGKHERMHRTLKRRTTRPPKANMRAFGPIWLGRFVEPKRRIFDSLGRGKRRTGGTCKGRRTVTQVS